MACKILGYDAELVLTDDNGNRLYINRLELDGQCLQVRVDLRDIEFAISEAEERGQWGLVSPTKYWRVER